jgi:hypothetical protein
MSFNLHVRNQILEHSVQKASSENRPARVSKLDKAIRDVIVRSIRDQVNHELADLLMRSENMRHLSYRTSEWLLKDLKWQTGEATIFVVLDQVGGAFDGSSASNLFGADPSLNG